MQLALFLVKGAAAMREAPAALAPESAAQMSLMLLHASLTANAAP